MQRALRTALMHPIVHPSASIRVRRGCNDRPPERMARLRRGTRRARINALHYSGRCNSGTICILLTAESKRRSLSIFLPLFPSLHPLSRFLLSLCVFFPPHPPSRFLLSLSLCLFPSFARPPFFSLFLSPSYTLLRAFAYLRAAGLLFALFTQALLILVLSGAFSVSPRVAFRYSHVATAMLDQRARLDPPIDLARPCLADRARQSLCKLTSLQMPGIKNRPSLPFSVKTQL